MRKEKWLRALAFAAALVMSLGMITINAYNLSPSTVKIAREMMMAYTVIAFFQSIQSVMTKGVLRGGGDTRFLLVADVLFLWICSLPLGYFVGLVLNWPAWITILCLRIDWMIKSFWCLGRLNSRKWIRETKKL